MQKYKEAIAQMERQYAGKWDIHFILRLDTTSVSLKE